MKYRASPADGCAWVTGASSGIGRAVALELARRGYQVFATARRAGELDALAAQAKGLSGSIVAAPGDVVDREGMAALASRIEATRPIALALFNAGGAFRDSFAQFGGEGFQRTLALNVQGVANGLNPVLTPMRERKRGQIAIVGSVAGYGGLPNAYAYAPSKAAVISLAVGLKFLVDRFNITVQIVNPGFIRTPMTKHLPEDMVSAPLGRPGKPEEVATFIVFLASDESSFSTGSEFVVDGGLITDVPHRAMP